MPVIYKKKIREALASIDIEKLKNEILCRGFEYIREGGFKKEDEPFKFSNYIFYTHPDSKMRIRIGHHKELWMNNAVFEICYCPDGMKWWTDITPDFRKAEWRKVSSWY
jgi:hypothetical protein